MACFKSIISLKGYAQHSHIQRYLRLGLMWIMHTMEIFSYKEELNYVIFRKIEVAENYQIKQLSWSQND